MENPNFEKPSGSVQKPRFENTWLFLEKAFLEATPSRKFMTVPQEISARLSLQDFIIRMGTNLKLDCYTIYAATLYVNRYYMRIPITTSKYFVASAAIAISTKLHDTYRQPDKIALIASNIKGNGKPVTENSEQFWKWRDQLLFREELLLKYLNFELNIEFPYEIRDNLLSYEEKEQELFSEKKSEIVRKTVGFIETLSSLPLLVAYDIDTVFVALLIQAMYLARSKFELENSTLPKHLIQDNFNIDLDVCYNCQNYIFKLLKSCDKNDPRTANLIQLSTTIKAIDFETFKSIANCTT